MRHRKRKLFLISMMGSWGSPPPDHVPSIWTDWTYHELISLSSWIVLQNLKFGE
jgi:hypothetical protein